MLDVELLRAFLAAAEAGSIHGGARKLHASQPTVSRALRRLERTLGVELFNRSPRGVELTQSGQDLLVHVRDIVSLMDQVPEVARRGAGGRRIVVVGLTGGGSIGASFLADRIFEKVVSAAPNIELVVRELNFSNQFTAIENGEVDLGLVHLPYEGDKLVTQALYSEPMLLAFRKDNPMNGSRTTHVRDAIEFPMVDMQGVPDYWNDFWLLGKPVEAAIPHYQRQVRTLAELRYAIISTGAVMPIAQGASASLRTDMLTSIKLEGAPLASAGIAYRSDESRPEIFNVVQCARKATEKHIGLIEGGIPSD